MAISSILAIVRIFSFVLMLVILRDLQKVQASTEGEEEVCYFIPCPLSSKFPNPTTMSEGKTDDVNATEPPTSTQRATTFLTTSENISTTISTPAPGCCGPCADSCKTCFGPGENNCSTCIDDYELSESGYHDCWMCNQNCFLECGVKADRCPCIEERCKDCKQNLSYGRCIPVQSVSYPLIIGIAAGGLILVILVVAVCCCIWRRHKKPPHPIERDFSLGMRGIELESRRLDSGSNLHEAIDKTGIVNPQVVDDQLYGNVDSRGNILMSTNPDDGAVSSVTKSYPQRPKLQTPADSEASPDYGGVYTNVIIEPTSADPSDSGEMYTNPDNQPRVPSHPKMPALPKKIPSLPQKTTADRSFPSRPGEAKQNKPSFGRSENQEIHKDFSDSPRQRYPLVHQESDDVPTHAPPPPPGKKPSPTHEQARDLRELHVQSVKLPLVQPKRSGKKSSPNIPTKPKVVRQIDDESDLRGHVQMGVPVSPTQRPSFTPNPPQDFGSDYEVTIEQKAQPDHVRQIDNESDLRGHVQMGVPVSLTQRSSFTPNPPQDFGSDYEVTTEQESQPDHGMNYEVVDLKQQAPVSYTDYGQSYECVKTEELKDFGGLYEHVDVAGGTDYGGTYEDVENPVRPCKIDMSKRGPPPMPKQVHMDTSPTEELKDFGGLYERVDGEVGTDYGGTYEDVENLVRPRKIDMSKRGPPPMPKQVPSTSQSAHKMQPKLPKKPRDIPQPRRPQLQTPITQEEPADFGGEYTNMSAPGPKAHSFPSPSRPAPPLPSKPQINEQILYDQAAGADTGIVMAKFQGEEESDVYENNQGIRRYRNIPGKAVHTPIQGGNYIKIKK